MDYTAIQNCFDTLNERSKWPFGKENIEARLECLEYIRNNSSLLYALQLVDHLNHSNAAIRQKTAETIIYLGTKQKSLQGRAESVKHLHIQPADLENYRVNFDEPVYLQLLGIASLNRSGYVRQKAVWELGNLKNTGALKFILFRLADWAEPVRKAALDALNGFMQPQYANAFLEELPMIEWLLSVQRVELKDVYERIMIFLTKLNVSIDELSDKARYYYARQLLKRKTLTKEELLKLAHDSNFLIQLAVLKSVNELDEELVNIFLHARSPKVKMAALYASQSENSILELLSDEAASVRELSRYRLKEKNIDFSKIYRDRINNNQSLAGNIMGLAETGSRADVQLFENYIYSNKNSIVIACLSAINKFDADKAAAYAVNFLSHSSARVRRKAIEVLVKNTDAETLEKVRMIYASGDAETKAAILKLYNKIGGWRVLNDLLLAVSDENNRVWKYLENWMAKAAHNFTIPPVYVMERAREILSTLNIPPERKQLMNDIEYYARKNH